MFGMGRGKGCRRRAAMSLSDLQTGSTAVITSFAGGRGCREKMTSMGLFPGTEIKVVQAHGDHGMMLVSVGSTRLMVDRVMAARVIVEKAG